MDIGGTNPHLQRGVNDQRQKTGRDQDSPARPAIEFLKQSLGYVQRKSLKENFYDHRSKPLNP
jgi:hypothetical protein